MTIRARHTFNLPIIGNVHFTRTLKPGKRIEGQRYRGLRREAVAVNNETTAAITREMGWYTVEKTYTDEGKDINNRKELRDIPTMLGRVTVFWEPTLPAQSRR